ncbi:MAG TPA: proton-conducting transporter membrane subunit [Armatimonadota bacterium]|nr:proton-conducting transporter membrane subunit [Armatimonadota bacterium]
MFFVIPALLALLGLIRQSARWLPGTAASLMLLQLAFVIWRCLPALGQNTVIPHDFGLDSIGAAFLIITSLVATAAIVHAALLLPAERSEMPEITDRRFCRFYLLSGLFLAAMYAVLLSQNLGGLWIAMEATTLVSAPLVLFHRTRHALEASWKYLLLCSVGIAFALFGTMLIVASQHSLGGESSLRWHDLLMRAAQCDPRLLRLGFIFCLLGYGTKAGLFPLHNWLPDAHSEAPAPASAMLSGALLNCALLAIWRLAQVMDAAGQGHLVQQILVPAGAITVLAAGILLIRQHDLKRMWAYSSVEHVGLLTLAIGIGATPIFLLHALNHSLVKVALFLLAGSIMHLYGSKALRKVSGLLRTVPVWGILLIAASFAIAGSPPFGTFISEWLLLRDTFGAGEFLAAGVVIVGLTITFIAITMHVGRILYGRAVKVQHQRPSFSWSLVPAILLLAALLTGIALAPPVSKALATIASIGGVLR